jgi:chromosomal replication initiation ATPase DnaA
VNEPLAGQRRREYVLTAAARLFDVPRFSIMAGSRIPSVCRARQACMAAMRQAFALSSPEVARLFERDHKAVLKALPRVVADPRYQLLLDEVRNEFPAG